MDIPLAILASGSALLVVLVFAATSTLLLSVVKSTRTCAIVIFKWWSSFAGQTATPNRKLETSATTLLLSKMALSSPYADNEHAALPLPLRTLQSLPTELLEAILRQIHPDTHSLLAFALSCTWAASLSFPILYSTIHFSSVATLVHLSASVHSTPQLAPRLVALVASSSNKHFLQHAPHDLTLIEDAVSRYSPCDELTGVGLDTLSEELASYLHTLSALTMLTTKLEKQCSATQLACLPLVRLTHLVGQCPNLTTVDFSALAPGALPPLVAYGAHDLLLLLRQRKGRFRFPGVPFSSICLTTAVASPPKVHGIVGIDWGGGGRRRHATTKALTVICLKSATWLKGLRYPVDYVLIPIHNLVDPDEIRAGEWTVELDSCDRHH